MNKIVPSIIPRNVEQMTEEIKLVSGFANFVQVDISDGIFTNYKTWPYNGKDLDFFNSLVGEEFGWPKWDEIDFELHLMVKNPENILEDWIKTGISSVVAHIEATDDFQKIIDICVLHQVEIWLALKPSTDISSIKPFVSQINGIQCMGSDLLGKHGVELDDKSIEQIKKIRKEYPEVPIAVDIGVNLDTKNVLINAGATKFICGSAILDADNPQEVFEEMLL